MIEKMDLTKRVGRNPRGGCDFVVGDVHGMFSLLRACLDRVGFNESTDRLFSVGDLVDRGPESDKVLDWLRQPWFYAVRGNHEQMAIDHFRGFGAPAMYKANGGGWFMALDEVRQHEICHAFEALPIIMTVESRFGFAGIVHSAPLVGHWDQLVEALQTYGPKTVIHAESCLWSRARWQCGSVAKAEDVIGGIDRVFCGHTPGTKVEISGNVTNLDTRAFAFGGHLTVMQIDGVGFCQAQNLTGATA